MKKMILLIVCGWESEEGRKLRDMVKLSSNIGDSDKPCTPKYIESAFASMSGNHCR